MILRIDPSSATPPFDQLRVQVIAHIGSGAMVAGTRLPTVRRLAADLGLAPNTVARAYKELEAAGFIETRGRAGSFVRAAPESVEQQALGAAQTYVERLRELGVSQADTVAYVTTFLQS
ncbi:GntR family transcriptional regulator [Cryobacterium cheniae]|uniref:GntR family transcriptional regulator n=1 Tax=Cryobacterium cheniae TaxID=1259262 RepID=UPI00141AE8BF